MNVRTIGAAAIVLALLALAACTSESEQQRGPLLKAEIVPSDAGKKGISFREVLQIAANRSEMSCFELTLGSLYAGALKNVADPRLVEADESTRLLAGSIGGKADKLIESELACHCDRGAPMPGYEVFERREQLLQNRRAPRISAELAAFYPKDETGQPRFLSNGEKLERAVLDQLPAAPAKARYDDCDRLCKEARKRTNAKAVAEGQPEPFPNLEYPRKQPCVNGAPPA